MTPRQKHLENAFKKINKEVEPIFRREMAKYAKKYGWNWEDTWLWLTHNNHCDICRIAQCVIEPKYKKRK